MTVLANMKKFVLGAVLLGGVVLFAQLSHAKEVLEIIQPQGETHVFDIELADEIEEWKLGLMNREHMDQNHGMLFVFPNTEHRTFWMKNTLIPLDMLFINDDGVIGHIHHQAKPHDETRIYSTIPAKAVLEINGGLAEQYNLKIGDKINADALKGLAQ